MTKRLRMTVTITGWFECEDRMPETEAKRVVDDSPLGVWGWSSENGGYGWYPDPRNGKPTCKVEIVETGPVRRVRARKKP